MNHKNRIYVPGNDPLTFSIFLTWLHTGDLEQSNELRNLAIPKEQAQAAAIKYIFQLVKCHVLADYLQAESFQNTTMDLLLTRLQEAVEALHVYTGTNSTDMIYMFQNTTPASPL